DFLSSLKPLLSSQIGEYFDASNGAQTSCIKIIIKIYHQLANTKIIPAYTSTPTLLLSKWSLLLIQPKARLSNLSRVSVILSIDKIFGKSVYSLKNCRLFFGLVLVFRCLRSVVVRFQPSYLDCVSEHQTPCATGNSR
ncbi:hypothetical protein AMECASPLE_003280, partial [Ameca splendens]